MFGFDSWQISQKTLQLEGPLSIIPSSLLVFQMWKLRLREEKPLVKVIQPVRGRARTRTRPPQESQFGALSTEPVKCNCLGTYHLETHFMLKGTGVYQTLT